MGLTAFFASDQSRWNEADNSKGSFVRPKTDEEVAWEVAREKSLMDVEDPASLQPLYQAQLAVTSAQATSGVRSRMLHESRLEASIRSHTEPYHLS